MGAPKGNAKTKTTLRGKAKISSTNQSNAIRLLSPELASILPVTSRFTASPKRNQPYGKLSNAKTIINPIRASNARNTGLGVLATFLRHAKKVTTCPIPRACVCYVLDYFRMTRSPPLNNTWRSSNLTSSQSSGFDDSFS
jgi:hypothetical protein